MKRIALRLSIALLVSILSCASAWAQATAQVSGTVRDESGAVLPGVDVSATQTETGVTRNTVTNETGNYAMPNMPLGPYRIEAALPGFRTFAQTGIVLQVSSSVVVNPVLAVGQLTESVEVQANAAAVETRNQGVGQVIENAKILELPLNGRNVTDLITLTPATVYGGNTGGGSTLSQLFNRNSTVALAGGSTFGITYLLDGAYHNNPVNNQNMSVPFPDALREFKVETSATGAQSGTHGSGTVTLVTKSGTNELHGDLFEFVRNYGFNARNAFAVERDNLKRNQFGGTIGGPIIKNKLFFFGGYQGTTIRQATSAVITVATPQELAGDFTAAASPACNSGRQINLNPPFVNNRTEPAQFSPVIVNLLNRPDFPKSSDPCGRLVWQTPNRENWHFPVFKMDYQLSANHALFGRYLADSQVRPDPYLSSHDLLAISTAPLSGLAQAATLGDTYVFGPSVVNAFRLSVLRTAVNSNPVTVPSWQSLGANVTASETVYATVAGATLFAPGLGTTAKSIGNGGGHRNDISNTYGLSDDVNILRGNHQLNIGFSGFLARTHLTSGRYFAGQAVFSGAVRGLGVADLFLGDVASFTQSSTQYQFTKQWLSAFYGSDTWKATKKLTVSLGIRWEPYFPLQWTDGSAYNFSLSDLAKGIRSTHYVNSPPGWSVPGDPNFPGGDQAPWNTQWRNFSPRVGLAWDVTGDGRTSVRAGAGTFYDFVPAVSYYGVNYSTPFVTLLAVNNVKIDNPWANYPGGNPFPTTQGPKATFPAYSAFASLPPNPNNPNVQQWNLSLQRQVGPDWLLSAIYVGNHTVHQWMSRAINPAVYIPGSSCVLNGATYSPCSSVGNTNQRRILNLQYPQLNGAFGNIVELDDGGTSSYEGLIFAVQRRLSHGVSINTNYTWSHCITDSIAASVPGGAVPNTASFGYSNPNNRHFDRGDCPLDRRQTFIFTASAETPRFSKRALQAIAGGWKLVPLLRIQSGDSMSVTNSSDIALNGVTPQRVNQVLPNVYGNRSISNFLNPSAFSTPQTGTLGNMGPTNIRGPKYWSLDMALSKAFRVSESKTVEIRGEAFNLTNSVRLNDPTTVLQSPLFGQITSAQDPRIMQFALKYIF